MTKAFRSVLLFSLLCFLTLGVAWGQSNQNDPADSQFTQSFGVDSINLQNLSVNLNVPVLQKPGAIPFGYSWAGISDCVVVLDGHTPVPGKWAYCGIGFRKVFSPGGNLNIRASAISSTNGWTLSGSSTTATCAADLGTKTTWTNLYATAPDLSTYYLPAADSYVTESGGTSCVSNLNDYTLQGGMHVTTNNTAVTVAPPDGKVYTSTSVADPFGNQISYNVLSTNFTDTLNNTALTLGASGATYHDTTGTAQTVSQVLSTATTIKTAFACSGINDSSYTGSVLSEIDYPDGNNIHFAYESVTGGVTGRISQVTYRTGGTASYTYGSPATCLSLIPSSLSRTTTDGTTTYTFAIFGSGPWGTTTTVLDPGKNKTVYTFMGTNSLGQPLTSNAPLTLTQVQTYQNTGTVASPSYTLLSTTIYCYNGNSTNCPTTQAAYPITEKDTYTAPGSKATYSRVKQLFDSYGNVTSIARYSAFVAIGTGTADNTTTITYGSYNGTNCVAVGSSIINLPCDVKTTAGANTLAESRYTYSSKGFTTQAQQWNGTSSPWITASASPNTNGTVASSTSPLGIATTYSYAATGSGGCNAMLPTRTSKTVNSVALTTGATWDCNMGKLMSATDANSNTSNFTYDLLGRPSSQADPLTYTLSESYPSATSSTLTDSLYFTTTNTADGLGRTIRSQRTDGASYDTVSIGYGFTTGTNPQWQISSSQPCIATLGADCTSVHAYITDPIGRAINTHTTSNEVVATAFNQNDVSTTLSPSPSGEHNKTVQTEYDGMGRVISTCALQTTGGTACGQVDGNSGILNSYTYSYNANGSTNVVNVRGGQNHTDVFDTVGRDYSVFRVESGTTTYTYDTISTADACHGSGFASNGTLLRVTANDGSYFCYDYDPLARVTAIGNSNNSTTPCRRFAYDATANGIASPPTGYPTSNNNILGRVVEVETDNCTIPYTPVTDEWFAYDPDGRITDVWESTPHSGGYYHTQASYALNGQLASVSGVPGQSAYTITLDSNGRPDSSKYGTNGVGSNVVYNGAGQPTEIDYQGTDKDTYSYDSNTGSMTGWTFKVGTPTETGALTWNTNRTLKTLAITDGFNSGGTQTCHYNPTDAAGSGYDDAGRLVGVNCGTPWTQTYTYDQYSNFSKSGTTNWNPGYNSANNHVTGGGYDGDGRVTYDLNNSYAWDVYGKMITANSGASLGSCGSAGVTCITYDAFGRPAEKNVGGTITEMLYSPIGLTGIMSGQTANHFRVPIPGGSQIDFTPSGGWNISHLDWLGSARIISTLGGHAVTTDQAYSPYGETYALFGTTGRLNFTGDFQDLYSGLYDTPNRQFDVSSGSRWLTPDPARASWNAYSYPVNPNSFIDPSGLEGDDSVSPKRNLLGDVTQQTASYSYPVYSPWSVDPLNLMGQIPGVLTLKATWTTSVDLGNGFVPSFTNYSYTMSNGTSFIDMSSGMPTGNGLSPIVTSRSVPGIPSKHVKPQIQSPYKMKPILPTIIGMADMTPEEMAELLRQLITNSSDPTGFALADELAEGMVAPATSGTSILEAAYAAAMGGGSAYLDLGASTGAGAVGGVTGGAPLLLFMGLKGGVDNVRQGLINPADLVGIQ